MTESPREMLAAALTGYLTPEQLQKLIDEVLASTKRMNAEVTCRHCGRRQMAFVQVNDAKAVALALPDLLNQAFGRVGEQNQQNDPVLFKRLTVLSDDEELEGALRTVEENRRRHADERRQDGTLHPAGNGDGTQQAAGDPDLQEQHPGDTTAE
jgi:hypothetical protein